MSDKKNLIQKVKELFSSELKFVDVTTTDGRILRTPDLSAEQSIVEIVDGVEAQLEDGVYETESLIITVENNMIKDIKEIEVVEVDETAEEVVEEMEETEVVEEEDKFIDATLKDGTMVHVTTQIEGNLTVGDLVEVVDAEGNKTLAPEGSHELEDGTVIVLDGESKISEIILPEGEEEVVVEEELSNDTYVEELFGLIKKLKENEIRLESELKDLKSKFSKFAAEPAEEETKTKVTFSEVTKQDKLKHFARRK